MLKVNNGEVVIQGSKIALMAEYTHLTHQLIECKAFDVSEIEECVRIAKKPEAEVEAEAKEAVLNFINKLFDELE